MAIGDLPAEVARWITAPSRPLHRRHAHRLLPLLAGLLFAQGRRTVASWLRAAANGEGFQRSYYLLGSLGRKADWVAALLLRRAARGRAHFASTACPPMGRFALPVRTGLPDYLNLPAQETGAQATGRPGSTASRVGRAQARSDWPAPGLAWWSVKRR